MKFKTEPFGRGVGMTDEEAVASKLTAARILDNRLLHLLDVLKEDVQQVLDECGVELDGDFVEFAIFKNSGTVQITEK